MSEDGAMFGQKERLCMMPKQPFISIPLDIPDLRVLQTDLTASGNYILTVESTLETTICHRCGREISDLHGLEQSRLLRHLPILGKPLYLRIRPKRFRCPFCDNHPTTTQQLDWYDPKALHTKAYERHLIVQLIGSTLTDVTEKEDVSYACLLSVLDRWVATSVNWEDLPPCPTLGIDEIALLKGHRDYLVVISARDHSGVLHLLAILPDRLKTTLVAWLKALPDAVRDRITTVCTDMWEGYVNAVEEVLPSAQIVIDRFHVARHYREAVDRLRKQEIKRLKQELGDQQHDDLKHLMWPLRKHSSFLSEEEQARLERLFGLSPALKQAVELREQLTAIFETARSKPDALRRLRFWKQRVVRSGLKCFEPFLKLLETWQDRIANYFIARANSGFVEGLNTKLKVLKRRCYGMRNIGRLFQRLTLDVAGYRRFSPWNSPTTSSTLHGNS
jgi:transposase